MFLNTFQHVNKHCNRICHAYCLMVTKDALAH
jgi:hypothetical protein